MGKESDVMMEYLKDNDRFADLFNGGVFGGQPVVKPCDLMEGAESYRETYFKNGQGSDQNSSSRKGKKISITRYRDVKKRLSTGGHLKILAVEDQDRVDFTMPWRHMDYDSLEYGRQIRMLKKKNEHDGLLKGEAERMCGLKKEDRLEPCFTVCFYHGREKWDGPRSLKDMMDFGGNSVLWKNLFSDYQMQLICLNEMEDFSVFQSPLKELFALLAHREDKKGLKRLLEENPTYQRMDEETAEVAGVFLGVEKIMENKQVYQKEEGYNVCKAIQEMMSDSWSEGMNAGIEKGIEQGIEKGIEQGIEQGICRGQTLGENRLGRLIVKLMSEGLSDAVIRVSEDEAVREQYYKRYDI